MKSKKPIEEKDLNKLLNDLFMQENSGNVDEASAHFVFSQEYDVKTDPEKEKQVLKKLNNTSGGFWKPWTVISTVLVIVTGGIIYFKTIHTGHINKENDRGQVFSHSNKDKTPLTVSATDSLTGIVYTKTILDNDTTFTSNDSSAIQPKENILYHASEPSEATASAFNHSLAEEKTYQLEKSKMLERIVNIDKGLYSSIEEGKISYRGKEVILDPFVLRNQSITNLEYKIFLADLLKNGKTKDYEKAMVRSEVWNNYSHNLLAATYFSDNRYNSFPVVNISADGAILFCKWLETEANSYLQEHKSKSKIKIRLPFDSEWVFATKCGYVHFPDCDGYNTIYDKTEGIVDAHYLKWTGQIKKRDKKNPHELDLPYAANRYGMNEKQVLQLFEQGENSASKLVSDSVYPFKMDVYNKVAHVSEIIYTHGSYATTVIGSCWKSKQEYLQMLDEFKKESASPYIGFRIVLLNGNKASYKAPFW